MAGEREGLVDERVVSGTSGFLGAIGTVFALSFEAVWVLGFGGAVVVMWIDPQGAGSMSLAEKFGMTAAFVAGIGLGWWMGIPPKRVALTPDGLRISSLWRSELVPFTDITGVDQFTWGHPRMVTLSFSRPTVFGRAVRYRPRGEGLFAFVGMGVEDADVVEIRHRVLRARPPGPIPH